MQEGQKKEKMKQREMKKEKKKYMRIS